MGLDGLKKTPEFDLGGPYTTVHRTLVTVIFKRCSSELAYSSTVIHLKHLWNMMASILGDFKTLR